MDTISWNSRPVAMTVAGSDNSAGAGVQADLKTFSSFGVYGVMSVTCVVAEVPGKVESVVAMTPELAALQIALLDEAFPVGAVKTGMLHTRGIIDAVADALEAMARGGGARLPLVVDPVMVASSGDPLLEPDAIDGYRARMFPMATLVTPNLDEAAMLLGCGIESLPRLREAACELAGMLDCAVLLKGGHLPLDEAIDVLVADGRVVELTSPRVKGVQTHGTGCTYSAAITAGLAFGRPLEEAVRAAKDYIDRAIRGSLQWKRGFGATMALEHFPQG